MTQTSSFPRLAATTRRAESPDLRPQATCPLCHTRHALLTQQALDAGDDWQCGRCGQRWDALRLQTVADYAIWDEGRASDAREGRGDDSGHVAPGVGAGSVNEPTALRDAIFTWDGEGGLPSNKGEKTRAQRDGSGSDATTNA